MFRFKFFKIDTQNPIITFSFEVDYILIEVNECIVILLLLYYFFITNLMDF
jgi:hypothetical protein